MSCKGVRLDQAWISTPKKQRGRKTTLSLLPFMATAVFLMVVGAAMSAYAPGAKSIGQVLDFACAKRAAR
ncbi:hypothetical protein B472_10565 [Limnohabitans sp. Rim28]|jgi:hypothetical protein|nr:hypothetical protein B472_10565 [Limnohabitans sp. Rim28]